MDNYLPRGIVVDQLGNYVVADNRNHRIQIFNSQGQFVRKFGSEGYENGLMNFPTGVGLLSNGNMVVGENGNPLIFVNTYNRLQILDSQRYRPHQVVWNRPDSISLWCLHGS